MNIKFAIYSITKSCKKYFSTTRKSRIETVNTRMLPSLNIMFMFISFFFHFNFFQMWIFSLGRTLMKTLPKATALTSMKSMQSVQNQCAIVLQATIYKMCNFNVDERASLMFLLNVSIQYIKKLSIFRNIKNFPHVIVCLCRLISK